MRSSTWRRALIGCVAVAGLAAIRVALETRSPERSAGTPLPPSQGPAAPAERADAPPHVAPAPRVVPVALPDAREPAAAVDLLAGVLRSGAQSPEVRAEAALALGRAPDPSATQALLGGLREIRDPHLAMAVVLGLGSRPFSESEAAYADLLRSGDRDPTLRLATIEALSKSSQAALPLLLEAAARDADPVVRAAAVRAASGLDRDAAAGLQLTALLAGERSPEVRAALYTALASQPAAAGPELLDAALDETDRDVRAQGLRAAAALARLGPASDLAQAFDRSAVVELLRTAEEAPSEALRLEAVEALRLAGTPSAKRALSSLADSAPDPAVARASARAIAEEERVADEPKGITSPREGRD